MQEVDSVGAISYGLALYVSERVGDQIMSFSRELYSYCVVALGRRLQARYLPSQGITLFWQTTIHALNCFYWLNVCLHLNKLWRRAKVAFLLTTHLSHLLKEPRRVKRV